MATAPPATAPAERRTAASGTATAREAVPAHEAPAPDAAPGPGGPAPEAAPAREASRGGRASAAREAAEAGEATAAPKAPDATVRGTTTAREAPETAVRGTASAREARAPEASGQETTGRGAGTRETAEREAPARAAAPARPGVVDADTLRQRWPDVLDAVKSERRVAWMLLNTASVDSLEGGVLTVAFAKEGQAKCSATCAANSRVGSRISERGMRARARPRSSRVSIGSTKDAVLPVPVCAMPSTSRPVTATGTAFS